MNTAQMFLARSADLVVQEHDAELLVYDERTEVAHCLNAVAATAWRACDGQTDLAGITRAVAAQHSGAEAEQLTLRALEELEGKELFETSRNEGGYSRRQIMRRAAVAGVAAAAVPMIVSATIATPQAAAYGTNGIHVACTSTANCAAGLTCQSGYCYTQGQTCTAAGSAPSSGTCSNKGTNPVCCSGNCGQGGQQHNCA
jgi:hypothetical protein